MILTTATEPLIYVGLLDPDTEKTGRGTAESRNPPVKGWGAATPPMLLALVLAIVGSMPIAAQSCGSIQSFVRTSCRETVTGMSGDPGTSLYRASLPT